MRLAEAIRADRVADGHISIWWLGQAGFALKTAADKLLLIDPYLSDYCRQEWGAVRKLPPPLQPDELQPDLVVASHWHPDHLDPPTFRAFARVASTRVGGPPSCVMRLRVWGVPDDQLALVASGGDPLSIGDMRVHAAPARHDVPGILTEDAVGFLCDLGGVRVYHSGDTEYDHTMRALARANIDVMLVCVNGTAGNMNAHEAALLAWQLSPRVVVPMHFGLWVDEGYTNLGGEATLDPDIFIQTYRKLGGQAEVVVPQVGTPIVVSRAGAVPAGARA